ncbi:MAG: NADH-quinone oxidoreductase subunit M [Bdellovibrionales bacterium]|nr:NADH-quinone oxidoreductase subunit M [Bdellovibrionales bacterium]
MFLSTLIFMPFVFALIVLFVPSKYIRSVSFGLALGHFFYSLNLLRFFDSSSHAIQLAQKIPWLPSLGITYFVGVDGISFWLVLLSTFLTPIVILASWESIKENVRGFHISLFALTSFMLGSFLAIDGVLFYVFFEASLIPMYFIIGIWGGQRRLYATVKFFIYTMLGSLFMLLAIIYLMKLTQVQFGQMSASILDWYKLEIPFVAGEFINTQTLLMIAFSLAFAIKVPLFPLHTWLPDAHVEAPTSGSVVLAAVMLKMGTYGFLRFVIPLFPGAVDYWSWVFLLLAVVGIIYGALVAMVQPDVKKLVAYSSVSHMGYIVLGLFVFNNYSVTGALYQMLNHGISTGALFLLVGLIYERTHSREISKYGGLASAAPWIGICFLIVTFSSIAVPMTNGFVGEFLILLGSFSTKKPFAVAASTGVVLGAAYMLWMTKKVFFGVESDLVKSEKLHLKEKGEKFDLRWREVAYLTPFLGLIFWMGIFPGHFLSYSTASLQHLTQSKGHYELQVLFASENDSKVVENNYQGK